MSATSWNHPTWFAKDRGPGQTRANRGNGWVAAGPLPFTNSITAVITFLMSSEFSANGGENQGITSVGWSGAAGAGFATWLQNTDTNPSLRVYFYDTNGSTLRYDYAVGDEDGSSWLSFDKWYTVCIGANTAQCTISVNGSASPTLTENTSNPGSLNLDAGTERMTHCGPSASWGIPFTSVTSSWPSVLLGPTAVDAAYVDVTSTAFLSRIFDGSELKPAGENGSLWFNDSYTTSSGYAPDVFLKDGSPRVETGSAGLTFLSMNASGAHGGAPGCLRKSYV